MIAMHREIIIPLEDLRYLTVECGDCHARIGLDLESDSLNIVACPGCHADFDPGVARHVVALSSTYKHRKAAKHTFAFRVVEKTS